MKLTRQSLVIPAALFICAFVLGLIELGKKSFWDDEAFSAIAIELSPSDLFSFTVHHDQHTGPYHALLKLWSIVGGTNEVWLRSLSAVMAALAVVVFHATVRRLYGPAIAVVASVFLMANGFFLAYAQEARQYALALLLICLAMWRFVIAATGTDRSNWLWWGLCAGLCTYGHPFALIASLSVLLSLFALPKWSTRRLDIAIGVAIAAVTCAPMLFILVFNKYNHLYWTQPFGFAPLANIAYNLTGRGNPAMTVVVSVATLSFVVAALMRIRRSHRDVENWRDVFVALWAFVLPTVVIVVSISKSFLVARYLIAAFPATVLATTLFVWRLRNRVTRGVLAVALAGSAFAAMSNWYIDSPKDDWRSLTAYVTDRAESTDGILFTRSNRMPFEYYLLKNGGNADVSPKPISPRRDWGSPMPNVEPLVDFTSSNAIRQAVAPYKRVWIPYLEERGLDPLLTMTLQELYGPPTSKAFDGLVLSLYQIPDQTS